MTRRNYKTESDLAGPLEDAALGRNGALESMRALSEHTVRNYLIRIFDKLGISSRLELVLYAFSGTEGNVTSENSKTFSASA